MSLHKCYRRNLELLIFVTVLKSIFSFENADEYDKLKISYYDMTPIVPCGSDIVQENFKGIIGFVHADTSVLYPEFDYEKQMFLLKLHEGAHLGIENIQLPTTSPNKDRLGLYMENFIIFGKTTKRVLEIFEDMSQLRSWNPRAKYLLVIFEHFPDNTLMNDIVKLKQELWKKWIYNIAVLVTDDATYSVYKIYTWFPYAKGLCGHDQSELNLVGYCGKNLSAYNDDLFPEKIPNDLNGCPIRVTTHVWPIYVLPPKVMAPKGMKQNLTDGIEITLMNMMAKRANITLEYKLDVDSENWGDVLPNRTTTGILANIAKGDADVIVGGFLQTNTRRSLYDMSTQLFYDEVTFIVQRAEIVERWKSLSRIFKIKVWIGLFSSFLIASVVMHFLMQTAGGISPSLKDLSASFLQHWSAIFILPVTYKPFTTIVRIVFILWVLSSFLLNAAYQTSLISVLTQPSHEKQVSSIEEMFEKKFNFSLSIPIHNYVKSWHQESVFQQILQRSEVCNPVIECLHSVKNNSLIGTLSSQSFYNYESWKFRDNYGLPKMYVFKDKIVLYMSVMYMSRGFPLRDRMDKIITHIKEAGLMDLLLTNLFFEAKQEEEEASMVFETKEPIPLKLDHLQGVFFLLFIGWFFAVAVFLMELSNSYVKKRKMKSKVHETFVYID